MLVFPDPWCPGKNDASGAFVSVTILAAVVVAAVLAIVVAAYSLRVAVLGNDFDSEQVVDLLNEDFPAFTAERVVFDSAGRGALVLPKKPGPIGFVWQLRSKTVTRLLSPEQLRSWSINGPQLKLRLARFSALAPTLLIDDPDDLVEIQKALETG